MSGEVEYGDWLWIKPVGDDTLRRKANQWDKAYLADFVKNKRWAEVVVNDEYADSGIILITVTKKAWEEMKVLG